MYYMYATALTFTNHFNQAKMRFPSEDGKIPIAPFLITAPNTLCRQWISEGHKFLANGAFRILPADYNSNSAVRNHFWSTVVPNQHSADTPLIIIGAHTVATLS